MMNRITASMTAATTRSNLQESARTLADLQERVATRQAISRPSDDPAGTRTALAARAELTRTAQYERNLQNADLWLSTVDSTLQSGLGVMGRVQELSLRGANGSLNQAGRDAIVAEVEQLRGELLGMANTQVLGRSIFAGTHAGPAAYSGTPPVWNGADGATVQRRISDTATLQVDLPGPQAFGDGEDSVFAVLDRLAQALRGSGDVAASVTEVTVARQRMSDALAVSGTRHATAGRTLETVQTRLMELEATRLAAEETDLAEAALQAQTQMVYYQAALAVSAQAVQTSLLDYLR